MSGRARKILLTLGILLMLISLVLILAASAPGETGQAQATLQPTLFVPPAGGG